MKNDYCMSILAILLDQYEDSPAFRRGELPSRRRILRMYDGGKSDFPSYDIENHTARKEINRAVMGLADKGIVGFRWMKGQQNHILSGVWLNYEEISQAYTCLGRRPKGASIDDLLAVLRRLLDESKEDWIAGWLIDTIASISEKRSFGHSLPQDEEERDDLLKAISFLNKRAETETLIRVFSMQCFGDSKRFERIVKARLVRIIKKYIALDDCADDEALQMIGLVSYPELFEFTGPLTLTINGGSLDFSLLPYGGTLTVRDLERGSIGLSKGVRRVLTIENRANYIEYVYKLRKEDEVVIYHGGQFSPAKRGFLRAVASAMPEGCEVCHWGDIDYGGFLMLARLRREIFPQAKAWRMNEAELKALSGYAVGFSEGYAKKVKTLLNNPELDDCVECIEAMLNLRLRLEQEAMLI